MTRPVCLITGTTSGIGTPTAAAMAAAGYEVIMACRNVPKAEEVAGALAEKTGNPDLHVVACDLASLASVRRCAAEVVSRFPRLQVLINNAGTMTHGRQISEDGLELTFAANYLGPWLLTRLLLEPLGAGRPARIVNVASAAHRSGRLRLDDLTGEAAPPVTGMAAYARSKLGNVMATLSLAEQLAGTGVTANCLHPGVVGTNITGRAGAFLRLGMKLAAPFMRSEAKGAETTLHLALDPAVAGVSGRYFNEHGRPVAPAPAAADPEARRALWAWSCRFCGLPEEVGEPA